MSTKKAKRTNFQKHIEAIILSWQRLSRAPVVNLVSILLIVTALTLPTVLLVLANNAQSVSSGWQNGAEIAMYLYPDTPESQVNRLERYLESRDDVVKFRYISPEQGLAEFSEQLQAGKALASLKKNPLPPVMYALPASHLTTLQLQQLIEQLQLQTMVQEVQLDREWLQRLSAIVGFIRHLGMMLGVVLGIGVLLIIGNAIYLATQRFHREITIYQLVGATNSYIRRPFLYAGMLFGFAGGLATWIVVSILSHWLDHHVTLLAKLYGSNAHLSSLAFKQGLELTLFSTALGFIGAWLALHQRLKRTYSS